MANFNRDNKRSGGGFNRGFGGDKSFGGGKRFDSRDGGRPAMYKAVCSECGANCELPFKPTGDRPVFCSNCFGKQNEGGNRPSRFGGERRERPRFEDRQMHDATCAKCGKPCQVPFRPTAGKPIFCDNCFDKGDRGSSKDSAGGVMEQIKLLNIKMDKLMKILAPNAVIEKVEKLEDKKETVKGKIPPRGRDARISSQIKDLEKFGKKAKVKIAAKKVPAKKKK